MIQAEIDELEAAAADGWRAPDETALGGWRLRAAGGFTGRANSALAVGDPGMPVQATTEEVARWYRARGLRPMVAIAFPLARPNMSDVDRLLEQRGWTVGHGAIVMTAAPDTVAERAAPVLGSTARAVDLDDEPDEAWLELYRPRGRTPPPIAGHLLMSAPWQAFGSVREDGQTVAIGRVAVAAGWAGLTAVAVDPGRRRRGLGGAITAALANAAAARGATGIYLQVERDNDAARSLYRRQGFADHHEYHYRVAPEAAAPFVLPPRSLCAQASRRSAPNADAATPGHSFRPAKARSIGPPSG
ncbi:MAG TPA: GNAT family N-acetyltransferase [Streptosporangiaceae bacterium]|nr:GNAT family N-acetyltransferase [Streptosporangiaceae bacterium]